MRKILFFFMLFYSGGLLAKPIVFVALPKTASSYIELLLSRGLSKSSVNISQTSPPYNQIVPRQLSRLVKVDGINKNHLAPVPVNIELLKRYGLKIIVHVRDPRQSMVSWTHHCNYCYPKKIMGVDTIVFPRGYFEWPLSKQFDYQIDHVFGEFVDWIQGWLQVYEQGLLEMKFTTYEDFHENKIKFLEDILDFLSIPRSSFRLPRIDKHFLFRKGSIDEWREVLTAEQQEKMTSMMPEEFFSFFHWDP